MKKFVYTIFTIFFVSLAAFAQDPGDILHYGPDAYFYGTIHGGSYAGYVGDATIVDILNNYHDNDLEHILSELGITKQGFTSLSDNSTYVDYSISKQITGGHYYVTVNSATDHFHFNLDEVDYTVEQSSFTVDISPYKGTNANPNLVYVYIYANAGVPTLTASTTYPGDLGIEHIDIAEIMLGDVVNDHATNYGSFSTPMTLYEFIYNVYERFWDEGPLYVSGMGVTSSASNLTIAAGEMKIIFEEIDTQSKTIGTDGQYWIAGDASFATSTTFAYGDLYSNGTAIGNNKYFNVVLGIVPSTVDGTNCRILALVQTAPTLEYTSFSAAYTDQYHATIYEPVDPFLRNLFIKVCRIIVQKAGVNYTLQQFPTGLYHEDIRWRNVGTGSGQSITSLSPFTEDSVFIFPRDLTKKLYVPISIGSPGSVTAEFFYGDVSSATVIDSASNFISDDLESILAALNSRINTSYSSLALYPQVWVGDGTINDVSLEYLAEGNTSLLSIHGFEYVKKTTQSEAAGFYEYEEIVDGNGHITAIRPETIIPYGSRCVLKYLKVDR